MKPLLFVVPALLASTAVIQDEEPIILRLKFKEGETVTYRSVNREQVSIEGEHSDGVTEATLQVAAGKSTDGWTDVVLSYRELKSTAEGTGELFPLYLDVDVSMQLDGRGSVRGLKGKATAPESEEVAALVEAMLTGVMNGGFLGIQYPEKAVKPKDKWEVILDAETTIAPAVSAATGGAATVEGKLTVKYELKAIKSVNGAKTAEIGIALTGTPMIDAGLVSGEIVLAVTATMLVDVASGQPIRVDQTVSTTFDLGITKLQTDGRLLLWRA